MTIRPSAKLTRFIVLAVAGLLTLTFMAPALANNGNGNGNGGNSNNDCVSLNTADSEELQTLRHVDEDRAEEIIANRPFRNVNHLLQLSFWQDPRQLAEMVDGDVKVCEYDVAAVDAEVDGPPFPKIDGVQYSQGRVGERHVEGTGVLHEVGDRVVFAGFARGGTTVADFRVFSTSEQNENLNWNNWKQQPHQTIMLPLQ